MQTLDIDILNEKVFFVNNLCSFESIASRILYEEI